MCIINVVRSVSLFIDRPWDYTLYTNTSISDLNRRLVYLFCTACIKFYHSILTRSPWLYELDASVRIWKEWDLQYLCYLRRSDCLSTRDTYVGHYIMCHSVWLTNSNNWVRCMLCTLSLFKVIKIWHNLGIIKN